MLPTSVLGAALDCAHIRIDQQSFHFKKLGGPKTVHWSRHSPPSVDNTTFTLDICDPLPLDNKVKKEERCDAGTRICGYERAYKDGIDMGLTHVIPIAGEYTLSNGRHLDPKFTRLNGSDSNADSQLEGIRIELHGGRYADQLQKAIIEMICDPELEGTEGFTDEAVELGSREEVSNLDEKNEEGDGDDEKEKLPDLDKGKALQFVSYLTERDDKVLRLKWKTKYACESQAGGPEDSEPGSGKGDGEGRSSSGWGFFTWFLIVVFLLVAAYIVFGSWLNYNRYGARGWDLIPHGDTIRDLPYIIKDLFASLTGKLGGGSGSRGGYSAV